MEILKHIIDKTIKLYQEGKISEFINHLLLLKNEVAKYEPEKMSLDLVDFLMDESMFDWVLQSFNKAPTDFDWEAASFVVEDLKDILNNNKISV